MAKPPDCSHCQKQATIHLTQIINNQIKKLDFCEGCPHQQGVTDPAGFSLAELLAQSEKDAEPIETDQSGTTCVTCGFAPNDFKKLGRLGCPDCYDNLESLIEPMLERMHRGTKHVGKLPDHLIHRVRMKAKIKQAEYALQHAIANEAFEDAAKLRDELKALKSAFDSGNFDSADHADRTA
ncbi:MAG: UvrB/UvrC motif-containing protein [Verrucomicrobiota bacterium]